MSGHISGGAECIITERDSYMARLPKRKASSCAVVEAKICCPAVVLGKWIIVLLGVKFVVLGAKKLSFWGQKLHILSFFHRVKAHEVVSACGVSADVAQHHVSWAGSIAWHWLCLRFCAVFSWIQQVEDMLRDKDLLKLNLLQKITWQSPLHSWMGSISGLRQTVPFWDWVDQFWSSKQRRWKTWNLRLPDKAVATVHRLPCMDLANSGSWRGGKVQGEIWWRLWFRKPGKPLHSLCTGLVLNHPCKPRTV